MASNHTYTSRIEWTGNTGEGTISSERISKAIRQARRDSSVKAIVLRVNSGGGGALPLAALGQQQQQPAA